MRKSYDFVVIGAGVFGAWIASSLHGNGFTVALLDAYGPANSRASSGGETRIIRMAYGPDEFYTRWAALSLPLWKELGERKHQQLFHETGVFWLSDGSDTHTQQTLDVLNRNRVPYHKLSAAEIRTNYPQLSFSDVQLGILETESGVLMARQAVQALVSDAIARGVEYFLAAVEPPPNQKLNDIRTTTGDCFSAGTFIFACGPWLPKLFPDLLQLRIHPTRQEVFFLGVPVGDNSFSVHNMPAWMHHTHRLRPYALPDIASRGFKISFDRHGIDFDPDNGSRVIGEEAVAELRTYLEQNIPRLANAPVIETRVCQYENTSNGDFLIDRHPDCENVWLVGGGSGHGFKHGPAVGEHVKDVLLSKILPEPRFSLAAKQTTRARAVF